MLSDIGIESSIIHNKRGNDVAFLNTAWTMRLIQGVIIWLSICLIAPFAATFYDQPMLSLLLPAAGLGSVIGGLTSTKLALANRSLVLKKLVLIEVSSQSFGLLVMILWAWIDHSVWSLVWGSLVAASMKTIASHKLLEGKNNRLAWDREAVKELFGFGQWILISSILTFLAGEGNKLLIGAFLDVKLLAFFTLASTMSLMYWTLAQQVSNRVLFPAYSEIVRERPEDLKAVAAKFRLYLIAPGWLIALLFVLWGDHFMALLYDQRYIGSGNMLRVLAMGSLVGIIGGSYTGLLWAKGMAKRSTMILVAQISVQILGIIIGHHYLGEQGVILSVALVGWLLYPIQAYVHASIGLWEPKIDLPFVAISFFVVFLNYKDIL